MKRIEINEAYMRGLIRCDMESRGLSQRQWAQHMGFSPQFISEVLAGKRNVTDNLAKAMGYERTVIFHRAADRSKT